MQGVKELAGILEVPAATIEQRVRAHEAEGEVAASGEHARRPVPGQTAAAAGEDQVDSSVKLPLSVLAL